MTHDNALRTPYTAETTRIHLVHSRSWNIALTKKPAASARPMPHVVPQLAPQAYSRSSTDTLILAAAALTAPCVWVGHALLHVMHVL